MTATFFCVTDFIARGTNAAAAARGRALSAHRAGELPPRAGRDDRTQFLNEPSSAPYRGLRLRGAGHTPGTRGLPRLRLSRAWATHSLERHGIYPAALRRAPGARDLPLFSTGSAYAYNGYWPRLRPEDDGLYFRRRSDAERRAFCLEDFGRCMARMREVNGGGPQYLCWPWGQYAALSLACAREAGFEAAFSLERSANAAGGDVMRIHRIGVGKTKDGAWMASRLRMYSGSVSARFFFKLLRKRPEVKSVLYMTDSGKLSGGSRQMVNNIIGMRESGLRVTAVIPPGSGFHAALGPLTSGANPVEIVEFDGFRNYVRAAPFVARLARRVEADVVHTFHARAYKSAALAKLPLFGGARYRRSSTGGSSSRPTPSSPSTAWRPRG
jgi:hypothetical protein